MVRIISTNGVPRDEKTEDAYGEARAAQDKERDEEERRERQREAQEAYRQRQRE